MEHGRLWCEEHSTLDGAQRVLPTILKVGRFIGGCKQDAASAIASTRMCAIAQTPGKLGSASMSTNVLTGIH
jgi:hypothetical protein